MALFVAIGTAVVAYLQYHAAEKAIRISHDDSGKTMRLSYRPYVGVQGLLAVGKVDGKTAATVTLHFSAMGSSPALDATVQRRCVASDTAQRRENGMNVIVPPPEVWRRLTPAVSHSVMFPGTSLDFHCVAFLDPDPPPYVFAVGDASYKDVFSEDHKTTFCFETNPETGPQPRPMLPCSTGNKME